MMRSSQPTYIAASRVPTATRPANKEVILTPAPAKLRVGSRETPAAEEVADAEEEELVVAFAAASTFLKATRETEVAIFVV